MLQVRRSECCVCEYACVFVFGEGWRVESVCRDDRKMKKERIQRFEISNEDTLYSFNSMSEDLSSKEHCIAGSGSILSYVLSEDGTRPSEEKIIIYVRKRRLHTHTHTCASSKRGESLVLPRYCFVPSRLCFVVPSSYLHFSTLCNYTYATIRKK